jgi:glycosyltransferase involved in cell wall biosynthesis
MRKKRKRKNRIPRNRRTDSDTSDPLVARRQSEAPGLALLCAVQCAAAVLAGVVAIFAALDAREGRRPRPSADDLDPVDVSRRVSVIGPMRNEEINVRGWLEDVCAHGEIVGEIIVSDDDSTDDTLSIATQATRRDQRVRVVDGAPPDGWVGKTAACERAARVARGSWLLFSDADMRMARGTIDVAVAAAESFDADVCSLTATLECDTFLERVVMPTMATVIMSGHPLFLIHDARSSVGLVWGGFLLVRRSAYFAVGGHAAVRGEIAEDRALAERFKAFGYRIRLFDGHDLVRVRMYRGAREMWLGWRKNVYEGVRRNPMAAVFFALAQIATLVIPLPALTRLGFTRLTRRLRPLESKLAAYCAASAAACVVTRALRDRSIGANPLTVLGAPIAGAFIASVMLAAAWRSLTGRGQVWKERVIF